MTGCQAPGPVDVIDEPAALEVPEAVALVAAHNARVERLGLINARGSMEVRWVEDGRRREILGDAEVWYQRPALTTVRVTKFGEIGMVLGSNPDRNWLYTADPSVLYLGNNGEPLPAVGPDGLAIQPWSLLDLMGLSILDPATVQADVASDPDGWLVSAVGAGGRVRIAFDADTGLPRRVEALADDGTPLLASALRDYERVPLPGMAIVGCPRTAEVIEITTPDRTAELKLFLRTWTGDVAENVPRLCNLELVRRALRPERIVER